VLLAEVANYDRLYDELTKWMGLPYAAAQAGFSRADLLLRKEITAAGSPETSLAGLLIPATLKVAGAVNRLDSRIAALRVVEAIRLHASEHGRLPGSLAEITGVPVPLNPATGTAFDYTSDGAAATLLVPSVSGPPTTEIRYEITIRK
jgi:hypothetical protein